MLRGIAFRPGGGVVVTGSYKGAIDLGGGARTSNGDLDMFVLALGADGKYAWDYAFGSTGPDLVSDVAVAADGQIVVTGGYAGPIDLGGGAREFGGGADGFALALSSDGAYRWDWTLAGPGSDYGRGVAIDEDTIAISGHFGDGTLFAEHSGSYTNANGWSNADGFVVTLDRDGNEQWHWTLESDEWSSLHGIDFANGTIVVAGRVEGRVRSDSSIGELKDMDGIVVALAATGTTLWTRLIGDRGTDVAMDVAIAPGGEVIAVGNGGPPAQRSKGFLTRMRNGRISDWQQLDWLPARVSVDGKGQMLAGGSQRFVSEPKALLDQKIARGTHAALADTGDFVAFAGTAGKTGDLFVAVYELTAEK